MRRVPKPGGRLFVSDLRRDMTAPVGWLMWLATRPKAIRPGLRTSIAAAYTPSEAEALLRESRFEALAVSGNLMGPQVVATRQRGLRRLRALVLSKAPSRLPVQGMPQSTSSRSVAVRFMLAVSGSPSDSR